MTRRPRWASLAAFGATALLVAGMSGSALAQEAPPAAGPVTEYPNYGGEVDCANKTFNGAEYNGQVKRISAADDMTVVFELCNPDPAFLPKIAFSAFSINDTDHLLATGPDGSIVENAVGTGPYKLVEWRRGDQIILEANPDYWGEAPLSQRVIFRWSSEPGQKFIELQSGNVDGIDNVQPDDVEAIEGDANLRLIPREALNVFYLGFNNTYPPFDNEKIRQAIAQGIDRQALIDQFYPTGSSAASHFTPCSIAYGCEGEAWYDFDLAAAQALLAEGMAEAGVESISTKIHLRVVDRGYLPLPEQVATAIQAQLQENLGITAAVDIQESSTFIDNADRGMLDGIHMLGWGADFPDATNFLDFHFGGGASAQFGNQFPDIVAALNMGNSTADPETRRAAYEEANDLIRQHVPMIPVAHGGSATAWRADVQGNPHSSPLTTEIMAVVGPGADDQLVFMQSGEPAGLYCADETDGEALRVCEQIHQSLYSYEVGGTVAEPGLATECAANENLTVWTCTLREGVMFHDGSTLDAGDVVLSFAAQWDAAHPLHVGRDGSFTYYPGTWGGFLNPPPSEE